MQLKKQDVSPEELIPNLVKALSTAYRWAQNKMKSQLKEELKKLRVFIDREKARLLREKNRVIQEEIRRRVEEPIRLNQERVQRLIKEVNEGKAHAKDLYSVRQTLKNMEATKMQRIKKISTEIEKEYREKIQKVEENSNKYDLKIKLLSCLILR